MRRKTAFSGFFMGGIVMIITKDAGKEYPETASLASVMQELQPDYPAGRVNNMDFDRVAQIWRRTLACQVSV